MRGDLGPGLSVPSGSPHGRQFRLIQHPAHDADVRQGLQPIGIFDATSAAGSKPLPRLPGVLPSVGGAHKCQGSLTKLVYESND
jgi:hypothetical protein